MEARALMKILTMFGTRPEIIRLSRVIPLLDRHADHRLVHTGQNYDPRLSDIFFDELGVRPPDIHLGAQADSFAGQAAQIIERSAGVMERDRPDRLLVLGDTNSGLAAIVAARMGIPVYHMEAGNRCYDDRVPEEINRRIIDHCSDVLMPYTRRSYENLLREGVEPRRAYVTGNPIFEVLEHYRDRITGSDVLARLGIAAGHFTLVTLHRAENVDDSARLGRLLDGLSRVADLFAEPMIVSVHPRTRDRLAASGLAPASSHVRLLEPMGFFDFVALEKSATVVLSDSGTVQEECAIFRVPSVTLRDVTERPETIEAGSNMLAGADPDALARAVRLVLDHPPLWNPPTEYVERDVSTIVAKIVLGFAHGR
jgi:UDP-N-acetylglucosamine 2-epimerase (non-hydrolysing)